MKNKADMKSSALGMKVFLFTKHSSYLIQLFKLNYGIPHATIAKGIMFFELSFSPVFSSAQLLRNPSKEFRETL